MPAAVDLTGRTVGKLKVLRFAGSSENGRMWLCLCSCGQQTVVKATYLNREKTKSCGCSWHEARQMRNIRRFKDLEGKRFGRLKVLEMVFKRNKRCYWKCVCDCGRENLIDGHSLKRGATKSCGCLQSEKASEARRKAVKQAPRGKSGKFIRTKALPYK